jgi:mono/diheme cytochrome c family protein
MPMSQPARGPIPSRGEARLVADALDIALRARDIGIVARARAALPVQAADQEQVERGRYLVTLGGCTDCHTPGHFLGKPDMARQLGGSEVGSEVPGLGVFYGPNLTPDKETGLGNWSVADIVKAIRTGVRPDGRALVPIMPWQAYAKLTQSDAEAIAAYLKSLPAVRNQVPGPFGPSQIPTSFVMRIVPPAKPR